MLASEVFQQYVPRLERLVEQVAKDYDKQAELIVEGAFDKIDQQMLIPLEHLLRNAVSHGLEEDRQAAGKSEIGKVTIRLCNKDTEMVIDVTDDGAGLDLEAIRQKAQEKNIPIPDSDDEIKQLILKPGLTTVKKVTTSSGRGNGMSIIATGIKQLNGTLEFSSVAGQGTNFTVRIPLVARNG